ncbi:CarboxypepD_reg-like domain-containing protein [Saccharicrinis carchari]|uniref:CarboxypepD_reg-like domain-containing protein n=1 Tax=Saccharicrinis carchari TaxID=1168039 RepID=A0A521AHI4_SACCC|nr:DUF5686 and carboxypeptidase regulatory-like domain-containing protein [Saccharicrinis carchari]SMO34284.1 CarboxypepD_reg-like domain-containing protein [Saccharicrinis carchari]
MLSRYFQHNSSKNTFKKNIVPYRLKTLLLVLLINMAGTLVFSQVISGVITSSDGETIPFASIYIKELTTGTTTNAEGEYSIELPRGITHLSIQALGYIKVELEVNMQGADIRKDIVLKTQDYMIKEVRVYSGNEDPAYGIMRKTISLAPYFLRQVKHYRATVYLKGGFEMKNIPALFRRQLRNEGIEEGKTYVAESLNELTFNSPNQFVHKQISKRSTIPNNGEEQVLGFLNYSFYDSESELAISPVSRKAFSFYDFRYEGFFQQGEYFVNKIKVSPKRKNQQLFEGFIYIVDNLWNIHSVDLVNEQFLGKIHIKQVQEPVKGKAWLPVSYHFDVEVNKLGFNVTGNYRGSVKYKEVDLDFGLPVPTTLKKAYAKAEADKQILKEIESTQTQTKEQQKIESLLEKENISNREMKKLSRLMEQENQNRELSESGLRLKSRDSLFQIVTDTISPDSIDWNKYRPIPLSKKEIQSFGIRDSLTLAMAGLTEDSIEYKKETSHFVELIAKAIAGTKHYNHDSTFRIKYYGLINPTAFNFNSVDALTFSQKADIKKLLSNGMRLDFYPKIKYAFGPQELMWKARIKIDTEHINHTRFFVDGGQWSTDFNEETGISPFVNMASSLLLKDNYMKLYRNNYLWLGGRRDLANGLRFFIDLKYRDMDLLNNTTDYSFAYPEKNYSLNNKVFDRNLNSHFINRRAFEVESKLVYTPRYFYRIENNFKRMVSSDYPTFTLTYKGATDAVFNTQSRYHMMELGIEQELDWSLMYKINYNARAGYYFDHTSMHFSQFSHFNTAEVPVSFKKWSNSFNLLHDYRYSTNKWFVEAHFSYSMPYLFIKNLPFLQDKLWNEDLYFGHLSVPDFENYNEIGYGISRIFLVANLGVFVGFKDVDFHRWGVRVSINLP